MTCQELIMKLKQLPADATVEVWHPLRDAPTNKVGVKLEDDQTILIGVDYSL